MIQIAKSMVGMKRTLLQPVYLSAFFFAVIYSLISLVNHYYFRTYAFDLGIRNNAMYDYMHFQWNQASVMYPFKQFDNILGDHFCLLPIFFAPFQFVFGSYTLLIFQIASVLWGGIGIYRLVSVYSESKLLPALAQLHFYLIWGVFSALSFDYHDNVIAAMLLPWYVYHLTRKQYVFTWIYLIIILISKENMALWMIFVSLGLMIHFFQDKELRKFSLIQTLVSGLAFLLIMKVFMPLAGDGQQYQHNSFSALGSNTSEMLETVFLHPLKAFTLLFEAPASVNSAAYVGIKSELHFYLLAAGGIALIFRPQFLLMILPVLGQKLFNDDVVKWGVLGHYSIEFVPILTIALYAWISSFNSSRWKIWLAAIFLATNFLNTFSMHDKPTVSKYYLASQLRWFQARHYEREFDIQEAHRVLAMIPKDAVVSANHVFVPRLAFREQIYTYPHVGDDTEYILLLDNTNDVYPISRKDSDERIRLLKENPAWESIYQSGGFLLWRKKDL